MTVTADEVLGRAFDNANHLADYQDGFASHGNLGLQYRRIAALGWAGFLFSKIPDSDLVKFRPLPMIVLHNEALRSSRRAFWKASDRMRDRIILEFR